MESYEHQVRTLLALTRLAYAGLGGGSPTTWERDKDLPKRGPNDHAVGLVLLHDGEHLAGELREHPQLKPAYMRHLVCSMLYRGVSQLFRCPVTIFC